MAAMVYLPATRQDESEATGKSSVRLKVNWFGTASDDACEKIVSITRNSGIRVLGYPSLSQLGSAKTLWRDAGARTPLGSVPYR